MSGIRDIKRRIRAVTNIQHVTKAMQMVAAAKMRRAQSRVLAARPYALKLAEVAGRLAGVANARELPLAAPREVKTVGYVLITGDRGLSGAYNSSLIHLAETCLARGRPVRPLAARVTDISATTVKIQKAFQIFDDFDVSQAGELARQLMELFLQGQLMK